MNSKWEKAAKKKKSIAFKQAKGSCHNIQKIVVIKEIRRSFQEFTEQSYGKPLNVILQTSIL